MKRILVYIIAAMLLIPVIAACGSNAAETNSRSYFNAAVLEITDSTVLIRPFDGEKELLSADEISFEKDLVLDDGMPTLRVGDQVRIVYNGEIMETYPAKLAKVCGVYLLDNTGRVIK